MRFDVTDLRLFLHVVEARSIMHGAERSSMVLASASWRVSGMEDTLGVPRLVRDRRGVTLSPAGQCLVEHARAILQPGRAHAGRPGLFRARTIEHHAVAHEHQRAPAEGYLPSF
jgi:DNA-binding transcriptional LysR family regulator